MFKTTSNSDALPPQNRINKYLSLQIFNFKCLGHDITSETRTFLKPTLTWLPMTLLVFLCILMLIYAAQSRSNIHLVTDILSPFWQSLMVLIKIWCFLWNKKKMVRLVRHTWLWSLEASGPELKIIVEENKKERFFALLFCRYVLATNVMAFTSPFIVAFIYYWKGQGFMDNLEVPFKAGYHIIFDPKSYTGYLVAYFWNVIATIFIFHVSVGNDTLFSWFAYNVAAQFRILNLRFELAALSLRTQNNEPNFIKLIISHIRYHQRVIEMANYFNEVFMVTVFLTNIVSFLQIACLIFQIARVRELSTLAFHILFMVSVSLQLMLYCRGGQMIIDKSSSVAVNIYEHFQWHEMSMKSKKLLILPLMRAQKPCTLTGVFFVADLSLFLWVFKTSGSFFALLKSMEA